MIYELKSGDFLVVSPAGVRTLVSREPYPLGGGIGIVRSLRLVADALEMAEKATAPLRILGVTSPA